MAQDYVRTAFAKGLPKRRVIFVHALRNSLIPIATGLGHVFSLILAGSFLIEKVFNIDGMGYLGYTSILQRDYPVALGILVISSLLMLIGNISPTSSTRSSIRASASDDRRADPRSLVPQARPEVPAHQARLLLVPDHRHRVRRSRSFCRCS